ncbi:hypothetical protein [Microcystis phage Mae-JY09]
MADAGLSIGTATGGGTVAVDNLGGTLYPYGKLAVGGSGTATAVSPAAPLPTREHGGTIAAFSGTALVAGTVTATPTGTQAISGTVGVSGTALVQGTVTATAAGTQVVSGTVQATAGVTYQSTAVNAASGTTTIVTPGGGTQVHVYAQALVAGTVGSFILRSGNDLPLSGTIAVDQYGGLAQAVAPPGRLYSTVAGSALQLVVTSGTPNIGGVISYWLA